MIFIFLGFPGGSDGKASACNTGDPSSIPGKKEIATHFRILAWRIPWTEEPGGLQSMGSQRPHFLLSRDKIIEIGLLSSKQNI